MSIASLQHTLTAIVSSQVSSESLSHTMDKILDVFTLGIYGADKTGRASEMKNDPLDFGRAIIKWDPDFPEMPVQLTFNGRRHEISDTPQGGIRLQEYSQGQCKNIEGAVFALCAT